MKKNKKGLVVLCLVLLCVVLIAGIFILSQSPKREDDLKNPGEITDNVTPSGIDDDTALNDPEIKPDPIPVSDNPITEQNGNDIPLTVIEDKPEPPEIPDTAHSDDEDEPHEQPTDPDPALTNPDKKPDSTPKPAETTPPKDTSPQAGDTDGNGNVYIPGFGWVKDEGGGGQGEKSGSDGDWDKIIGH